MLRTSLTRQARLFSTSPAVRKSVVDSAKDAAKKVDRTISDAAVKGIETGGRLFSVNLGPFSTILWGGEFRYEEERGQMS